MLDAAFCVMYFFFSSEFVEQDTHLPGEFVVIKSIRYINAIYIPVCFLGMYCPDL